MVEFLKIQFRLKKITLDQLIELVSQGKLTQSELETIKGSEEK